MAFIDNQAPEDKLERAINAIIDQIEYLTTETPVPNKSNSSRNNAYDPAKDKIRSASDLVFQLSASLTQLMAAKNSIILSNKLSSEAESILNNFYNSDRGYRS